MKEILKKHLTNILKSGIMSKFAAKPNGSLELVEGKEKPLSQARENFKEI